MFLYQFGTECDEDFPVSFQIRIYNAGPEPAYNVVLAVEESQFQAPGLSMEDASNFNDADCDKLRCTWPVVHPGQSLTVTSMSDRFNIGEPREWVVSAVVDSNATDYNPANNSDEKQLLLSPQERADSCDTPPSTNPSYGMDFSGAGGGCFIAAAGYGSPSHPNIQTLREFRDNVLMDSAWGRALVEFYYRHSPDIACYIAERDSLQAITRWLLSPLVFAIRYPWAALMLLVSISLLLYAALRRWRRATPAQ